MNPTPGLLRLARMDEGGTVRVELHGSFDHHNADGLVRMVTDLLAEPVTPRNLHVDCAGVSAVDSSGLSALLMIRRATDAAGVRLHLDARPLKLERMLKLTGTLEHLTGHDADRPADSAAVPPADRIESNRTVRSGGTGTTT
ncbi:STAS domain-containing protein [Streptomyces sp. NPDC001568]|uniref:STAS domain-containing protein n=1 Tax=Streptomyces sp. NPDC001568 TaxID=3364588 RepID=UPI00368B14B3